MATVTSKLLVRARITELNSKDLGVARMEHLLEQSDDLASGTAASQQDMVWSDTRSAAASADALDLAGSLTSQLDGSTLTFVEITGIIIRNKSTTTTEVLTIGAGSNPLLNWVNATGDAVVLGPGGVFVITSPIDGYGVTAGTGDVLTIDPGSDTISYDILILGRSA